jgi:hypothetical protein
VLFPAPVAPTIAIFLARADVEVQTAQHRLLRGLHVERHGDARVGGEALKRYVPEVDVLEADLPPRARRGERGLHG